LVILAMRTTRVLTVSLPPGMVEEIEKVRQTEHRTRSDLVREALRAYIDSRYPMAVPTRAEFAALRKGRAQIRAGRSVTLDRLLDGLATARRPGRRKDARKAAR
jgi:Arc/MetJ-type ribon-helix-helix transcriptional regulator